MGLRKKMNDLADALSLAKKLEGVYVFDKRVFRYGIAFLFAIFMIIFFRGGVEDAFKEKIYLSCPSDSRTVCENPLYKNFAYCGRSLPSDSVVCTQEFLMPGFEWGQKKDFLQEYFGVLVALVILACFVFNHLAFNKGFRWREHFGKRKEDDDKW